MRSPDSHTPIPAHCQTPTATSIRPLSLDDVESVAAHCFPELPIEDVQERVVEDVRLTGARLGLTLVAEEAGRVGAFIKMLKRGDSGWLFDISAHPDFRGRGIIQRMIAQLAEAGAKMGIVRLFAHVRADNLRARRAYEKAGMKFAGQDGMRGEQLRYELRI